MKKTTTYDVGNPDPGLVHTRKYAYFSNLTIDTQHLSVLVINVDDILLMINCGISAYHH
jgi:hypothetical protein